MNEQGLPDHCQDVGSSEKEVSPGVARECRKSTNQPLDPSHLTSEFTGEEHVSSSEHWGEDSSIHSIRRIRTLDGANTCQCSWFFVDFLMLPIQGSFFKIHYCTQWVSIPFNFNELFLSLSLSNLKILKDPKHWPRRWPSNRG